jgi:hypothetical protein
MSTTDRLSLLECGIVRRELFLFLNLYERATGRLKQCEIRIGYVKWDGRLRRRDDAPNIGAIIASFWAVSLSAFPSLPRRRGRFATMALFPRIKRPVGQGHER